MYTVKCCHIWTRKEKTAEVKVHQVLKGEEMSMVRGSRKWLKDVYKFPTLKLRKEKEKEID